VFARHRPARSRQNSDGHLIPWQIADTKTRVYLYLVVSCGVLWCANLLTDRVIQSRGRPTGYVRDVGVAGSNPVTQTTDFIRVFLTQGVRGSRSAVLTVPKTVPVSAQENRARSRLSLDKRNETNTGGADPALAQEVPSIAHEGTEVNREQRVPVTPADWS
jgi:hypothetical protein